MIRKVWLVWLYAVGGILALIPVLPSIILTVLTGSANLGQRIFAPFWGRAALRFAGCRVRVLGHENFRGGPFVILVNHHTPCVFFAVCGYLPGAWRAVFRRELLAVPVVGFMIRLGGHVVIDLDDPERSRRDVMGAVHLLSKGISVVLAPEGRRSSPDRLLPFKRGGFDLAIESGVPILPLVVGELWERGRPVITVRALPPVETRSGFARDSAGLAREAEVRFRAALKDMVSGVS